MNLHKIPNALVIAVIVAFYATAFVAGWSWDVIRAHTISGVIALFILMAATYVGGIGPGTAKLSAAIALWMGPEWAALTISLAFLSLGVVGLLLQKFGSRLGNEMPFMPFAAGSVTFFAMRDVWLPLLG